MFRKALLILGVFATCMLLWFAQYNYRQAAPIAEDHLRGQALTLSAAIERLAAQDPGLATLSNFHAPDIAYFALVDRGNIYRFHSNPDLVGHETGESGLPRGDERVLLGTGERAFRVVTPFNLRGEPMSLLLILHTYRADAVVRRAKLDVAILLGLVCAGWGLSILLFRYARREQAHLIELTRRENLVRLGEMGAVLAHEIRNPLAGIKGFAQVIRKKPEDPRNGSFAGSIVEEAVRLESLVNDLLAYAAADKPAAGVVDLPALVNHCASLLAADAAAAGVHLSVAAPEAFILTGNRDRLEQVILNLGRNALQAMSEGGLLQIQVEGEKDAATITVRDNGAGIAETDLAQVFLPFFTTKSRGTGLGLALCKKFVEEHGGTISLKSRAGEGTAVTVKLPLSTPWQRSGNERNDPGC